MESEPAIKKHYSDSYMVSKIGTFFQHDDTWTIVDTTRTIYYNNILLVKVIKNAIPSNICKLGYDNFVDAGKMITTNRGSAAGQQSRINKKNYEQGIPVNSSIIGYINSTNHKRPCRLTEFTKKNMDKFQNAQEFIATIDNLFKMNVPDKYENQLNKAKETDFCIKDTSFSTITVNYNFRTALHKDSGDFRNGFGNIVVLENNIEGGHLLLPQYKIAIKLTTGDYCAFNVHEWHCNSDIIYKNSDSGSESIAELLSSDSKAAELLSSESKAELLSSDSKAAELLSSESKAAELLSSDSKAAELLSSESIAELLSSDSKAAELLSSDSKAAELLSSESIAELLSSESKAELLSSDSFRMSFVFYLRDKLEKCRQINGNLEKIVGNLEGKQWSSDILYKEIFKNCEKIYTSNKWWEMRSERYILEYKNKRYRLFDLEKDVVIHNLMNAWEYISNRHQFLMDDG